MTALCSNSIIALNENEIDALSGGTVVIGRVFYWAGVVQTIQWAGKVAYDAGVWVGSH